MSRSTRLSTVSNVSLIDCSAVREKTDTSTITKKKTISSTVLAKSPVVARRKYVSSKPTDFKDVSSKVSTHEIRTCCQNLGSMKHADDATSNRKTLNQKAKSGRIISSVGDKSLRNMIKVEPSCNETNSRTVRNKSSITKTHKITDKTSSTVAENTSQNLGVADLRLCRTYITADDVNRLGLFNPLNFTTACAMDSNNFEFVCQSCRIVRFKTYSELRLHEDWCGRTVREDMFYKCRTCDHKYHSQIVLARHESECKQDVSQVEKLKPTNPCDFSTIYAPDFRDFPFFCTSCHDVTFRTLDEMRLHANWCGIVLIGLQGSVICEDCGIAYKHATVLKGHQQGPPGCAKNSVRNQKRSASPFKGTEISGSVDSKRRKLNQNATISKVSVPAPKVKRKFAVVLCSKRKRNSQKSAAMYAKIKTTLMKMDKHSLHSSSECSPRRKKNIIQVTKKLSSVTTQRGDSINYSRKSVSASQSSKNELDAAVDMILESAISAADQASSVPGCQDTGKNTCPVCDVVIVGSVDAMCVHFHQFHNLAFSADSRYSVPSRYGRMGPTNCLDCDTLFDTRLEMTRHKKVCTKKSVPKSVPQFMCAICSTVSKSLCEFDTHLENFHGDVDVDTRHKQVCSKKSVQKNLIPRFMCAICSTISQSLDEFDTHVETFHGGVDQYQQILLNKIEFNPLPPRESSQPSEDIGENTKEQSLATEIKPEIVNETNNSAGVNSAVLRVIAPLRPTPISHRAMCSICPAVSESRDKFITHVQTFHGGVDKYQQIMFDQARHCCSAPVESKESRGPSECIGENTNEKTLANEIKPEIFEDINIFPDVNSAVIGVIIPVEVTATRRPTVDVSRIVEVPQKSRSHASNEKTNIDHVAIKKPQEVKNDLVVCTSDTKSPNDSLPKSVLEKSEASKAASGPSSSDDTVISDESRAVKTSLRVEDMVASISVNRSLHTKGSEGCVGKIKEENNPPNIQSNPTLEVVKKPSNPQLPVVFNTSALQSMFFKNGRKRLRLQTSLIPGSDIVVIGTETTLTATKCSTDTNTQMNDKKLSENIERKNLTNTCELSENIEQNKLVNNSKLCENIERDKLADTGANPTSIVDDSQSPGIDENEEQKKLLLALQLVPSSSVQSPDNKHDTTIVRKSKRQMVKQVDSVEKTTVEKRAMKMIAAKRDIGLTTGTGVSKLNKDKKAKISTESESVNTSSGACKTVEVSTRLSACTVAIRKLPERRKSTGKIIDAEPQNLRERESCSLGDILRRKQPSSGDMTGLTKQSTSVRSTSSLLLSEKVIEGHGEAVMSTTLTHSIECPTVQSELLLTDTSMHSGEGVLKSVEFPSSNILAQPAEPVFDQSASKSRISSELLIPAKKNMRRNLRILEPVDDVSLKCLECGSILRTAIEIVSHACPE